MATKDIAIYESGDGGEMRILNANLQLNRTIYQTIYLALFGGNTNEDLEWWGNELLHPNNQSKWLVSETERTLNNTPLNNQGIETIESAVRNDLEFLNDVVDFEIEVSIVALNQVKIKVLFFEIENVSNVQLEMTWNNEKNNLIIQETI